MSARAWDERAHDVEWNAGRLGAGKRRMTCPHAAIVSGGAKAAADLCREAGRGGPGRRMGSNALARQVGAAWPGTAGVQQCRRYRGGTRQGRG